VSELRFGDPGAIARRDQAVAGDPLERMHASFGRYFELKGDGGAGRVCGQCRWLDEWTELKRARACCSIYARTHRTIKTWPIMGAACTRFEPGSEPRHLTPERAKTPNNR